jgi:outer membrane immunogenic protein
MKPATGAFQMKQNVVRPAALSAALLLASVVPAAAADLGGKPGRPYPAEPPLGSWQPLQIEQWTGLYFGATYGYADGKIVWDDDLKIDHSGGIGTLFAGYNLQLGRAVVGVEADVWGLGDVSGKDELGLATADLDRLYSVRGRVGFLATPALLVYATGGAAWASYDLKFAGLTESQNFTGYQVGGGTELMLSPHWTVKLEYLFTDLGSEHVTGLDSTFDPDLHTVRAGLSFKF